jgi:hypothetical protein
VARLSAWLGNRSEGSGRAIPGGSGATIVSLGVSARRRGRSAAGRPIPPAVAACEHKRAKRAADFTFAAEAAGALLAASATASLSSKLVRRAETAVVAASRQRKASALRRDADVRVIWPASTQRGRIGRVIETLPGTDEFDLIVTFDETNAGIYAFKYQELEPVKVTTRFGRHGAANSHMTANLLPI